MADEEETPKHFWTSLPGILTGITGILSALTAFYVAVFGGSRPPSDDPAKTVVSTASPKSPAVADPLAKAPAAADQPPVPDRFGLTAVIDDPDGFSNVRSARSASSAVLARVNRNETFSTYRQDGDWWEVRTRDGTFGYIHASRIRVIGNK